MSSNETPEGARWLLLIHQLPAKPAYARVKIWRRLKGLGAVTAKNSVYALPANAETREDFAWLVREIAELGGEAFVCEALLVDGIGDAEVQALFDAARDEDYAEVSATARELATRHSGADLAAQAARLRKQLDEIVAIDFFGADGREPAEGLVSGLEAGLQKEEDIVTMTEAKAASGPLKNRVWVTRQGVQIDRIASAWLIRRFIDQAARFKFVPGTGYSAEPGELRFDMFEGEFTHRGDRCTFEVLLADAKLDDPALTAIGEIIHDIDLKDGKYGREEAAGVRSLVAGIASSHNDDTQRLDRGAVLLDDLYRSFAGKQGGK
ncbi:chromate resistance protein ChrB domain-containing protein [Reyranella sp.]|uniref:chromate resistance protein ChrB domain-containing protein n=1 Tax=Reyranella sp. TaxID=1929291 RepID=UPI0025EC3964|nr:chromate resistance protein ChrB domain-containing protein [Reyranella sp.]